MAAGLPFLKLASLLVKQLAKPVSARLKVEAGRRKNVGASIEFIGQFIHQMTSRFNVFASGYSFLGVKPLPAEEALLKGVNFVSESVVFTIAGTIVILEYNRGEAKNVEKARKAAEKEAAEKKVLDERFETIIDRLNDLEAALPASSKRYLDLRRNARKQGQPLPLQDTYDLFARRSENTDKTQSSDQKPDDKTSTNKKDWISWLGL